MSRNIVLPVLQFDSSSDETLFLRRELLKRQGYILVGNHSAIKLCHWCKSSIKSNGPCYKESFYGIKSNRCIQASVTLDICNLKCQWCWRDIDYNPKKVKFNDDPKDIVDGFIEAQRKSLMGFYGDEKADKEVLDDAMEPKHVALSLTGDACMYPKLPELIKEIHNRGLTSFLVTNGTFPEMIKKLIDEQPTQLYITLPAADEETFEMMCRPNSKGVWKKILESLSLLKYFKRSVIRLTLANGMNFRDVEKYAEIFRNNIFTFLELKSAMPIGGAVYRLTRDNMISQEELRKFAEKIVELTDLKILDEQKESLVILMGESKENQLLPSTLCGVE